MDGISAKTNDFSQYVPSGAARLLINAEMLRAVGGLGYRINPNDRLFAYQDGGPYPTYVAVVRRMDGTNVSQTLVGKSHSDNPVQGAMLAFAEILGSESGNYLLSDPENIYLEPETSALDAIVRATNPRHLPTPVARVPDPSYASTPAEIGYGHGV